MREERYDAVKFGIRLKEIRKRNGMTQEKLAGKLMLTEESISNFERGKNTCMHEHLTRICQIFNTSADYFYFGIDRKLWLDEDSDYSVIIGIIDTCNHSELQRIRQMLPILLENKID